MELSHQKIILVKKPLSQYVRHKESGRLYSFFVSLSVVSNDVGKAFYQVYKSVRSKKVGMESVTKKIFTNKESAENEIVSFINNFEKTEVVSKELINEDNEALELTKFLKYAV